MSNSEFIIVAEFDLPQGSEVPPCVTNEAKSFLRDYTDRYASIGSLRFDGLNVLCKEQGSSKFNRLRSLGSGVVAIDKLLNTSVDESNRWRIETQFRSNNAHGSAMSWDEFLGKARDKIVRELPVSKVSLVLLGRTISSDASWRTIYTE